MSAFGGKADFPVERALASGQRSGCRLAHLPGVLLLELDWAAVSECRVQPLGVVDVLDKDVYRCPAGERLTYRYTNVENGQMLRRYWTTACPTCPLKSKCTTGKERRISRWEHEPASGLNAELVE